MHWKRAAQRVGWIVKQDGFLVLVPVTIPYQRPGQQGHRGEDTNSAGGWIEQCCVGEGDTGVFPVVDNLRVNNYVEHARFPVRVP